MSEAAYSIIGIDLGKDAIHIVAPDRRGAIVHQARCKRDHVTRAVARVIRRASGRKPVAVGTIWHDGCEPRAKTRACTLPPTCMPSRADGNTTATTPRRLPRQHCGPRCAAGGSRASSGRTCSCCIGFRRGSCANTPH